jgi:uroporphyrinogen decarboxylase
MLPRERVIAAIKNEAPDRVPMDFGGTMLAGCRSDFLEELRQVLGLSCPDDRDPDGGWVDDAILEHLGVELRYVPDAPPLVQLKEIDPAAYEQKLKEKKEQQAAEKQAIKTPGIHKEFPLADLEAADVAEMKPVLREAPVYMDWIIDTAKNYRSQGYATTFWLDCGFFETACWQRGYDQVAEDLLLEPELLKGLFDVWLEEKLHWADTVAKKLGPYIDIFCFGDDWAMQSGPFMSPATFDEVLKPYYVKHYGRVHEVAPDSFIHHHSCGSVYKLLDAVLDMGIDILNPIQPNAVDMAPELLKEKAGGRLCYHGGMDLQHLLPYGTPEEVTAETHRRKEILGKGGGYICAAAHALPEDVPVCNLLAMFE